jgi:hypothetical protein
MIGVLFCVGATSGDAALASKVHDSGGRMFYRHDDSFL